MKQLQVLFIISTFFFSICFSDESYVLMDMLSVMTDDPFLTQSNSHNSDSSNEYTFYRFENVYGKVTAKEGSFFSRPDCRKGTWAERNYHKIKTYSCCDWSRYFAGRTVNNIKPHNWSEELRSHLFASFELWEHEGYRKFLKSFPEYERMIVKIDELSRTNVSVYNALNDCVFERGWFSDTKLKDFIKQELPRAKSFVAEQKRKEDQKRKQEKLQKEREIKREKKKLFEEKEKRRLESAQQAQEVFFSRESELENTAVCFHEEAEFEIVENNGEELFHSRWYQQRVQAIKEAIRNGFKIEHRAYKISEHTRSLLKKHGIDSTVFDQCIGNAVQQEIHSEFVEIVNSSADLTTIDIGIDKETWFFTIGDLSSIGCGCNNAGQFNFAYALSTVCSGIFKCVESVIKNPDAVFRGLKKGSIEWVEDTASFVKRVVTDPIGLVADIGSLIGKSIKHVYAIHMHMATLDDFAFRHDERFLQEINRFNQEYQWFADEIKTRFEAFAELSESQKVEEVTRLTTKTVIAGKVAKVGCKYFGKLKKAAPKYLQKAKRFVKKFKDGGYAEDIPVGVTSQRVLIDIPSKWPVESGTCFMEQYQKDKVYRGIFGPVAEKAKENVDIWHRAESLNGKVENWALDKARDLEANGGFCDERFLELVKEGRPIIDKGRSVLESITNIGISEKEAEQLRDLFIETLGGKKTLKKLGLSDAVIDKEFIAHFTSPEMHTKINRSGNISRKLVGCHVYDSVLHESCAVEFNVVDDNGLIKTMSITCNGITKKSDSTFFPVDWTKEKIIVEVARSIKDGERIVNKNGVLKGIKSTISGDMKIVTYVENNRRFKTSYPVNILE